MTVNVANMFVRPPGPHTTDMHLDKSIIRFDQSFYQQYTRDGSIIVCVGGYVFVHNERVNTQNVYFSDDGYLHGKPVNLNHLPHGKRRDLAKNMVFNKMRMDVISQVTGWSTSEVRRLLTDDQP